MNNKCWNDCRCLVVSGKKVKTEWWDSDKKQAVLAAPCEDVRYGTKPCACSSSLLSSSECWLLPLVTFLALLRDRTPDPVFSITDGMASWHQHKDRHHYITHPVCDSYTRPQLSALHILSAKFVNISDSKFIVHCLIILKVCKGESTVPLKTTAA